MAIPTDELIKPIELRAKLADDELPPQVIDVRSPEEYTAGHLPNVVNIPGDEIGESLGEIDQKRPVVTYCNMQHPGSSRSERAASRLREAGIQAQALDGGFPAWKAAGYPVERGEPFRRFGKV